MSVSSTPTARSALYTCVNSLQIYYRLSFGHDSFGHDTNLLKMIFRTRLLYRVV